MKTGGRTLPDATRLMCEENHHPTAFGGLEVAARLDMATRAEPFRTEEQRHSKRRKARPSPAKKSAAASRRTKPGGVAGHATYALDPLPRMEGSRPRGDIERQPPAQEMESRIIEGPFR